MSAVRPSASWHARLSTWWPAAGLLMLAGTATLLTRADADLWGHVRFGLDMLESWTLPADDPYSFTQDKPWTNHEWLSELQMGFAYMVGGAAGLTLLKGLIVSSVFLLVWTGMAGTRVPVRVAALLLLVFGSLHLISPLRPHLWSFLFLALAYRALLGPDSTLRLALPVLFAVWANTHGGWIVGLGVVAVWAAVEGWRDTALRRRWAWLVPLCVVATLANPYGWGLWTFLAETVRIERDIQEWRPLWELEPWYWASWISGVLVSAWLLRRPMRHRVAVALVLAMLAFAGLLVMRIGPLFLLASIMLGAPAFARRWPLPSGGAVPERTVTEYVVGAMMVAVPAFAAVRVGAFALGCVPPLPAWRADSAPVESLRTAEPGRLVTSFNWGEYAIWHLGPRLRVSMDGRRETVYSEARLAEYEAIVEGRPAGLSVLDDWRAEYVWLPSSSVATRGWLVENGYRIDIQTPRSFVAVRDDLPPLPPPTSLDVVRTRCFPD